MESDECMSPLPDEEEFGFGAGSYTFEMCEADIQNYDEEPCAVCFDEKFEIQGKIEYVISVSLCVFASELISQNSIPTADANMFFVSTAFLNGYVN